MADINKIHVITKTIFVVMPPHTLWNVYEYSVHQSLYSMYIQYNPAVHVQVCTQKGKLLFSIDFRCCIPCRARM